ncbi:MAG: PDZ domain-containing protein, partial [Bacteroidetes bacterium]|nr:PDZ domain-containing protein [Bacteroidota bacterium]
INATTGGKSYDDVFRLLYNKYYKKLKRGFTESEYKSAVEEVSGKNMDDIFINYVNDTKQIDYNKYLNYAGLKIIDVNKNSKDKNLGVSSKIQNGKLIIRRVTKGTPAYNAGLNAKDEIIAVNNYRVDKKLLEKFIKENPAGANLDFLLSRDGKLLNIKVELLNNPLKKFVIEEVDEQTDKQILVYNKWLRIK